MRAELGSCLWIFLAGCSAPERARVPMEPLVIKPLPPVDPESQRPPPPPASADPPPPARALAPLPASTAVALATTIETFYQGTVPLDCDFSVETFDKTANVRTTRQAHVVFARPGEFAATFSSGRVVVAHASTLATFDPVTSRWFTTPIAPDFVPIALCYAGGPGSLNNHLAVVGYPGSVMNTQGLDVLVGSPRRPMANASKLLLYALPPGEVKRTMLLTPNGNRERWDQVRCAGATSTALPVVSNALPLSPASAKLLDEVASLTTPIP